MKVAGENKTVDLTGMTLDQISSYIKDLEENIKKLEEEKKSAESEHKSFREKVEQEIREAQARAEESEKKAEEIKKSYTEIGIEEEDLMPEETCANILGMKPEYLKHLRETNPDRCRTLIFNLADIAIQSITNELADYQIDDKGETLVKSINEVANFFEKYNDLTTVDSEFIPKFTEHAKQFAATRRQYEIYHKFIMTIANVNMMLSSELIRITYFTHQSPDHVIYKPKAVVQSEVEELKNKIATLESKIGSVESNIDKISEQKTEESTVDLPPESSPTESQDEGDSGIAPKRGRRKS